MIVNAPVITAISSTMTHPSNEFTTNWYTYISCSFHSAIAEMQHLLSASATQLACIRQRCLCLTGYWGDVQVDFQFYLNVAAAAALSN